MCSTTQKKVYLLDNVEEFTNMYEKLNPQNQHYVLGILESLNFAQETFEQREKSAEEGGQSS